MKRIQVQIDPGFFESTTRLQSKEQVRVLEFIQKIHKDPAQPGLSLERLGQGSDTKIWSARITQDLRAILYKDGDHIILIRADHHDAAYSWAERRQLRYNPRIGALQILEPLEVVERKVFATATAKPSSPSTAPEAHTPLFAAHSDEYLLSIGVPEDWLPTLRKIRDDDTLLRLIESLPPSLAEDLLALATGDLVAPTAPTSKVAEPAAAYTPTHTHLYTVEDEEELSRFISGSFENWLVFLHPSQRAIVQASYRGPAKITGSAGTGKTVVAIHRARHLARQGKRVLLTSFVRTLCKNIEQKLALLCSPAELDLIDVRTVHSAATRLAKQSGFTRRPVSDDRIRDLLSRHKGPSLDPFSLAFLLSEYRDVIEAQAIRTWPDYRAAPRRGRGLPLGIRERKRIWDAIQRVFDELDLHDQATYTDFCRIAREALEAQTIQSPYDAVLIDEVQDLKPQEIRFLSTLCTRDPGGLMLLGDAGQRIYPGGFSLRSLGIEVRGRSSTLRINYRTTEQIRLAADKILGRNSDDMNEGQEDRSRTRSLLRGPKPSLHAFYNETEEWDYLADELRQALQDGITPGALAVFVRSNAQAKRLTRHLDSAGLPVHQLGVTQDEDGNHIPISTMHRAKGLEFRRVYIAGCNSKSLPLAHALESETDPQIRRETTERDRSLLYVCLTRARDSAHITWAGEPSIFLQDLLTETS